jgi:hypothetical protein
MCLGIPGRITEGSRDLMAALREAHAQGLLTVGFAAMTGARWHRRALSTTAS